MLPQNKSLKYFSYYVFVQAIILSKQVIYLLSPSHQVYEWWGFCLLLFLYSHIIAWGLVNVGPVIKFALFSVGFYIYDLCYTLKRLIHILKLSFYICLSYNICFESMSIILYFLKYQHLINALYTTDVSLNCLLLTDWIKKIILQIRRFKNLSL